MMFTLLFTYIVCCVLLLFVLFVISDCVFLCFLFSMVPGVPFRRRECYISTELSYVFFCVFVFDGPFCVACHDTNAVRAICKNVLCQLLLLVFGVLLSTPTNST